MFADLYDNLSSFKISLSKILSLGYPRNDILFVKDDEFIKKLKNKFEIAGYIKRIILYAPTFRDDLVFSFHLTESEIKLLNDLLKKYLGKSKKLNFINLINLTEKIKFDEILKEI